MYLPELDSPCFLERSTTAVVLTFSAHTHTPCMPTIFQALSHRMCVQQRTIFFSSMSTTFLLVDFVDHIIIYSVSVLCMLWKARMGNVMPCHVTPNVWTIRQYSTYFLSILLSLEVYFSRSAQFSFVPSSVYVDVFSFADFIFEMKNKIRARRAWKRSSSS